LIGLALCFACANRLNPSGGPRDEDPPEVIAEGSTQNFQTHFNQPEIELALNEWVELNDPINQVLVSPPLDQRPDIRLKGKSVTFTFHEDEILKQDATYTINYGESIKDLTEGNSLSNYSFVFSTGAYIDSLIVAGQVVDAFSGEPVENATVMLYDNLQDSAVFLEKPFYASRSLKDGTFQIRNVKLDTFRVIALIDDNLNYLVDPENESMGFLNDFFIPSPDSSIDVKLELSKPEGPLFLDRVDTSDWNKAVITYNRTPFEIDIATRGSTDSIYWEGRDQNLEFWYLPNSAERQIVYLTDTRQNEIDTVILRTDVPPASEMISVQAKKINSGHPEDPFYLCFSRPLINIDSNRIQLRTASGQTDLKATFQSDSLSTCLNIQSNWQPDSTYMITLFPNAITDLFGLGNDTIQETFPIGGVDRFGNIELEASGFSKDHSYIIELLLSSKVERTIYLNRRDQLTAALDKLKPSTYTLRIIEDLNNNRRWDPADYSLQRQAERVITQSIEPLRANWDVEVIFEWNKDET